MRAQGFVYAGMVNGETLRTLLKELRGQVAYFLWDLATMRTGKGLPDDLRDNGIAFNDHCEIRWQRTGNDQFRVLALSDKATELPPLQQVQGEWTVETTDECPLRLVPLKVSQFCPPFERYPIVDSDKARLRCRVFYREGIAIFISPREVLPDE
jgi:hypothetical protein